MAKQPASIQPSPRPAVSFGSKLCLCLLLVLSTLAGCAYRSPIPVVERTQPPTEKINSHWVSEGETLYAIAWRYNLDAKRLAAANGLQDNARIYRGQTLRLDLAAALRERRPAPVATRTSRPAAVAASVKPGVSRPASRSKPKPAAPLPTVLAGDWRWPAKGSLVESFSFKRGSGHKGLDIGGRSGQPVHAAQNGLVVYAGSGLPAYGKLLIVKHSEEYLSAYAHNSQLLVREGDRVIAGQKIAKMGRTGTTHEHLHFEIRKRGVPVNPLALLPRQRGLG
ncbi:MAG: peptidoglycan DD-metalloendopeptidase family protein [Pseudomonadales bacterium]|nr:peptidoglycan DD-metalloendopeptidase family protein [Pseudomonadales bacterium]NNM11790.1 peptidoglycan DD-metalloendopeptidase family protein [Pseudomonadales bacterium]RZV50818.1 MAG: LysM peptidoglycan-binding domain-containing protein [Pseudomonadales bacterium]